MKLLAIYTNESKDIEFPRVSFFFFNSKRKKNLQFEYSCLCALWVFENYGVTVIVEDKPLEYQTNIPYLISSINRLQNRLLKAIEILRRRMSYIRTNE